MFKKGLIATSIALTLATGMDVQANDSNWVKITSAETVLDNSLCQTVGSCAGLLIINGNNFDLAVKAYPGYGIAVETEGVRIGDDWSAIPTLA